MYTVYIRHFWQGNHQIYGHIRRIYTAYIYGSGQPYICGCTSERSLAHAQLCTALHPHIDHTMPCTQQMRRDTPTHTSKPTWHRLPPGSSGTKCKCSQRTDALWPTPGLPAYQGSSSPLRHCHHPAPPPGRVCVYVCVCVCLCLCVCVCVLLCVCVNHSLHSRKLRCSGPKAQHRLLRCTYKIATRKIATGTDTRTHTARTYSS